VNPSPAFIEALSEERAAAQEQLRLSQSGELRRMALGRLADLDELEGLALAPIDTVNS